MREEIDINGKWLGISTKVVPEKLGFGLNTLKKFWSREVGNKFGSYDYLTLRTKSTYDENDNKIVMWEITSSYFSDKLYLKDSDTLAFILNNKNTHILDDMFYYRSLKNGSEEKEVKAVKKSRSGFGSYDYNSLYSEASFSSRYIHSGRITAVNPSAGSAIITSTPSEEISASTTETGSVDANGVVTSSVTNSGLNFDDDFFGTASGTSRPYGVTSAHSMSRWTTVFTDPDPVTTTNIHSSGLTAEEQRSTRYRQFIEQEVQRLAESRIRYGQYSRRI